MSDLEKKPQEESQNNKQESNSQDETLSRPVDEESIAAKDNPAKEDLSQLKSNVNLVDLNKVFVVGGDDLTMRNKVGEFLKTLKITPLFTHQKQGNFRPIAEIYNANKDISLAIVLLHADDFSYPRENGHPKDALMKSNQKVVFELGYCIGKLGRDRVIALYYDQKSYRCPTEFFDAMYIPFDKKNLWQLEVKTKLKNLGFTL